jgi:hypothetical protein
MKFYKKFDTENIVRLKKKKLKIKGIKRAFVWTKQRIFFFVFILKFFFFFDFLLKLIEVRLEKTELLDNFILEIINIQYINYFVAFFQNEVKNYPIIFLLNQIVNFNLFFINFYNFFCIYNSEHSEMLKNNSYLASTSKNKIEGKILEIKTGFTIAPGKYKKYFRNKKNEDIDLNNFEFKNEAYQWDEFFGKQELDNNQPYNMVNLIEVYGEEQKKEKLVEPLNEEEESEWEAVFGAKGFYDLRFLYSTVNRLRMEEKEFITDTFFYYKNFNKLRIDFFIFDEMVLRVLEIFVCGWYFLLKNNLFFNKKWDLVKNFLYSKLAFQLKIELNTFLYLTHNLSYFWNYMYDKYIYTHHKLYSKMRNRLSYVSKFYAPFEEKINLEYIKNLKNQNFFIVNFIKLSEAIYSLTVEKHICINLYKHSFFMQKFFNDENFFFWLRFIVKDLDWAYVNYLLYEVLLEKAGLFEIEKWFFYCYDNMDLYLNGLIEEKILMFSFLIKSIEREFILQCLSNTYYIYLYYLIIDNFIFFCPSKMHKFFLKELNFFWKFAKISIAYFFKKNIRLNMIEKLVEVRLNLLDEDLWFDWFLNKFKYYDFLNIKKIKIEIIDYFCFWICRVHRSYNWIASIYDIISFSKYVSNFIFCKYLFMKNLYKDYTEVDSKELVFFDIDNYLVISFYKDLILSYINKTFNLNVLFFFITLFKSDTFLNFKKYHFFRHFVWNDLKKLNL